VVRILSQRDATQPGRPGITRFRAGPQSGKRYDIRIVKANKPASGVNQNDFSYTEDIVGNPNPTIVVNDARHKRGTGDGRIRVKDNSGDRRINVR
jgi:hypothetical protein